MRAVCMGFPNGHPALRMKLAGYFQHPFWNYNRSQHLLLKCHYRRRQQEKERATDFLGERKAFYNSKEPTLLTSLHLALTIQSGKAKDNYDNWYASHENHVRQTKLLRPGTLDIMWESTNAISSSIRAVARPAERSKMENVFLSQSHPLWYFYRILLGEVPHTNPLRIIIADKIVLAIRWQKTQKGIKN